MNLFNSSSCDIERPTRRCSVTDRQLEPGEDFMATLVEIPDEQAASNGSGQADTGDRDPGPKRVSLLGDIQLKRVDVAMDAWGDGHRPENLFSFWKARVTPPTEKQKLFVDDEVLMNLFHRLADSSEPQRLAFRFVLALILMRKKLVRYERSEKRPCESGDQEWWVMTAKPSADRSNRQDAASDTTTLAGPETLDVLNPQLDEEQIRQVTEQLGEILEAQL